jgi:hypothetical protein
MKKITESTVSAITYIYVDVTVSEISDKNEKVTYENLQIRWTDFTQNLSSSCIYKENTNYKI